jgi:uncharacterized protein (TIGR02996 family)
MEEDDFLRGLDDNPSDDTLRLVFADWLEDREDRRGDFLRVAVQLRRAPAKDDKFLELLQRLQGLRSAVSPVWLLRAFRSLAEDDIREAVFHTLLGEDPVIVATFLGVESGQDPSPYLLARLSERYTGFLVASAADIQGGGVFDKQTGSRGCLVRITSLEWQSGDRCDVQAGAYWDGLAAHENLYRVGIKDGSWAVLDTFNLWIS